MEGHRGELRPSCLVLRVGVGEARRKVFARLECTEIVLGRDGDLRLPGPHLSRHHARIQRVGRAYCLVDLGSRNGVTINRLKIPVNQQVRLRDGDVIRLGRKTKLRFYQRAPNYAVRLADLRLELDRLARPCHEETSRLQAVRSSERLDPLADSRRLAPPPAAPAAVPPPLGLEGSESELLGPVGCGFDPFAEFGPASADDVVDHACRYLRGA
jgi:FHA domain